MTGASAPNTSTYNMLTDVIAAVTSNPMHYQQASYYKPRAPSNDPLLRPLPKSENRWVPPSVASQSPSPPPTSFTKSSHQQDPAAASQGPPVLASSSSTTKADPSTATLTQDDITRKVKGLLNKLTLEKFDTISDKIILYAEQSRTEDNGQSLRTVMKLVFEKACDEPAFAAMWAQLCRKLFEWMPNDIKDVSVLDKNGQPTSGVNLFYKYLLYRCQNGFEQGWSVSLPQTDGPVLSDEYYAAVKVKRQGLGLVQFIGELYRRGLLTTGIIYKCLKHLCDSGSQVREEEVESLCKLLTTVGADLDRNPQTAPFTDVFLKRMKTEMYNSPHLSSRVQFMMQDVFDLRDNNWVPRRGKQDGPKTIAEIHELAEKEKEEAARRVGQGRGVPLGRQTSQQNMAYRNGSTGTSGPGKNGKRPARSNVDRGVSGADGWSTVSAGQGYGSRRVNDLSNFGKSDRYQQRNNVLGPTNSPFAALHRTSGKHLDAKSHSTQETTNKFSALDDHDENQERPTIRPQARDTSETKQSLDDDRAGAEDDTKATQLDPTALKRRIDNTLQEFYSMNSVKDLMEDIQELKKSDMEPLLASALLNVVEKKLAQVESVCQLIPQLYDQQVLSKQVLTVAFQGFMELYEDLAIDVPQAPLYVAKLLLAANLTLEDVWTDNALGPLPSSLKDAYTNLKA
ncbi:ARM repeat-containing protein [Hesseltinella vesiculosa]|uniref:ARM repeat-containing protein n=1 Tax=Hesseltinella vesiculosa TaxID=101127 RepID=A0A1X2GI30_9FUNG|nr:ARM repeat-containing protein [Hesseltinella vesiculosa]